MAFRKHYTDEQFIKAVSNNESIAGVLRELNLVPAGGNYATVNRKIAKFNLDTSHFTGQLWSKGKFLKSYEEYKSKDSLRNRLITDFGRKCQMCGTETWLGKPINLEIHHVDGNNTNNRLENLELICPNCHSFTDNWRSSNIGKKK